MKQGENRTKNYLTFHRLYIDYSIVITDEFRPKYVTEEDKKELNFYFEITTGKITLPFFKSLNLNYASAIFFTKNLENFFNIFHEFSYLNFSVIDVENLKTSEDLYREHLKYYGDEKLAKRSYRLSYMPDMKGSIRTSLRNPDLYLSEDNIYANLTSNIIMLLEGGNKTYKELFMKMSIEELEFKKILKSLIFYKAVGKIGEKYKLLL